VAAVFAAQLALNYPSFADDCVTIRIYINLLRQSNLATAWRALFLELWGPLNREALGRLPTLPKAKAGTESNIVYLVTFLHHVFFIANNGWKYITYSDKSTASSFELN